jgi:hypothetical protein
MFYDLLKKAIALPSISVISGFITDTVSDAVSLVTSTNEQIMGPSFSDLETTTNLSRMRIKYLENDTVNATLIPCDDSNMGCTNFNDTYIPPCAPVNIACTNYDDLQSFQTPCGNFSAQCGPQVVETYFDPFKYISSESFTMPSISMPSISIPSFPSESLGHYAESFSNWLWQTKAPERIICDWNDVSCLYNEVNECVNAESSSGWAQCLLDSAKQYQEDNDISNQQIAIAAGLGIVAVAAAYKTLSWLYHRKTQEVFALDDDDFDYDLNSTFKIN